MIQLIANKTNSQTNNKIKQSTAKKLRVHCKLSLTNTHCQHKSTRCKQKIQHAANKRKKWARAGRCEELEPTDSYFWREFWHFEHGVQWQRFSRCWGECWGWWRRRNCKWRFTNFFPKLNKYKGNIKIVLTYSNTWLEISGLSSTKTKLFSS